MSKRSHVPAILLVAIYTLTYTHTAAANKGGQLKGNVVRTYDSGFLKLYGKLLDDQVIFYLSLIHI